MNINSGVAVFEKWSIISRDRILDLPKERRSFHLGVIGRTNDRSFPIIISMLIISKLDRFERSNWKRKKQISRDARYPRFEGKNHLANTRYNFLSSRREGIRHEIDGSDARPWEVGNGSITYVIGALLSTAKRAHSSNISGPIRYAYLAFFDFTRTIIHKLSR